MAAHEHNDSPRFHAHCCPCCDRSGSANEISRRDFLGGVGGVAAGAAALTGLSWTSLAAAEGDLEAAPKRRPLVVKPIFAYSTYTPHKQTSWRSWGGIGTEEAAQQEASRIKAELDKLQASADFPVTFLPLAPVRNPEELAAVKDLAGADAVLLYAADGGGVIDALGKYGKDTIIFVRHKSGPVYLWYEIVSPRYLRGHTDQLTVKGVDFQDVVVDSQDEILWRLRALCGLRNTVGSRILAIGGPSAWAQPAGVVPDLVRKLWKLDIQTIPYPELGELIKAAKQDQSAVALARRRTDEYLKKPGTSLETKRDYVENAFLLEQIFRRLMVKANCRAMTINGCMGTIMPMSETSACLSLSTLNDDGYLAFCESDFVVVPSGMLMGNISGNPTFLNDPTYPYPDPANPDGGIITLAHCTGPRKMDGKTEEPVRLLTHFESDYGAAPKVEMRKGQVVTNIVPDFAAKRWLGFLGEIIEAPFLPICRCQIDIRFKCGASVVAERMPGFHWMTIYGDYLREANYALKRIPIQLECVG